MTDEAGAAMLIAQITDPHIRAAGRLAYGMVDTAGALARAVGALNALEPRPDLVLVTGDLVDFGLDAEYGLFRELMAPLRAPWFALMGNHDERESFRAAFPEQPSPLSDGFIQYALEDWPVRILALDTLVPGNGFGRLCGRRLDWLKARLDAQPERPTIIAMHHPPFRTGIGHMDKIGLADADALRAVVAPHRSVQRIVCGHLHRDIVTTFAGTVAATCPSVAHQVVLDLRPDGPSAFALEPPAYQLHHWSERDGLRSHTAFIGSFDGPYPFFDEGGALID